MVEWILNIFEDKSDIARLITIILSSLIAIGIFLLNQRYIRKKARSDLMIEKLEEFFTAISEYEESTYDALTLCTEKERMLEMQKAVGSAISSLRKAHVIQNLYYPNLDFDRESFYKITHQYMPYLREKYSEDGMDGFELALNEVVETVRRSISELESEFKNEFLKYRH